MRVCHIEALLKAVARAHRWFDRHSSGRAGSVEEIALREGFTARYVRRLLGLAFLAPEMVEAIASGHQPPDLTAEALSQRINLPLDWSAQKEALDLLRSRPRNLRHPEFLAFRRPSDRGCPSLLSNGAASPANRECGSIFITNAGDAAPSGAAASGRDDPEPCAQ
jgi:hypothetical protein